MECCEKDLGIDKRIVNFGVPLGRVIFMPGVSVMFLAVGFCMAEIYGVTVSPVWLATAFLIAIVLAVAAPPIPGGALTCYTILFVQLKIPMESSGYHCPQCDTGICRYRGESVLSADGTCGTGNRS